MPTTPSPTSAPASAAPVAERSGRRKRAKPARGTLSRASLVFGPDSPGSVAAAAAPLAEEPAVQPAGAAAVVEVGARVAGGHFLADRLADHAAALDLLAHRDALGDAAGGLVGHAARDVAGIGLGDALGHAAGAADLLGLVAG